jgi:hypothetical protein
MRTGPQIPSRSAVRDAALTGSQIPDSSEKITAHPANPLTRCMAGPTVTGEAQAVKRQRNGPGSGGPSPSRESQKNFTLYDTLTPRPISGARSLMKDVWRRYSVSVRL